MLILSIRTDKPEAEIGLYENGRQVDYLVWTAHRELAETLHAKIIALLESNNFTLDDLNGVVAYKGPGSFTGLRIGLSVGNALAYGLGIPLTGSAGENQWLEKGLARLAEGKSDGLAMPEYGAPVHITTPKK